MSPNPTGFRLRGKRAPQSALPLRCCRVAGQARSGERMTNARFFSTSVHQNNFIIICLHWWNPTELIVTSFFFSIHLSLSLSPPFFLLSIQNLNSFAYSLNLTPLFVFVSSSAQDQIADGSSQSVSSCIIRIIRFE